MFSTKSAPTNISAIIEGLEETVDNLTQQSSDVESINIFFLYIILNYAI